jgi:hypothetical protein
VRVKPSPDEKLFNDVSIVGFCVPIAEIFELVMFGKGTVETQSGPHTVPQRPDKSVELGNKAPSDFRKYYADAR